MGFALICGLEGGFQRASAVEDEMFFTRFLVGAEVAVADELEAVEGLSRGQAFFHEPFAFRPGVRVETFQEREAFGFFRFIEDQGFIEVEGRRTGGRGFDEMDGAIGFAAFEVGA